MPTASRFPDHVEMSGPRPIRITPGALDFPVGRLPMEDGGVETNNPYPCGARTWTLEYDGLSEADAALLDAHMNEARNALEFLFYNSQEDRLYDRCKYRSYRVSQHSKYWSLKRRIEIVRYP